MRTGLSRVWGGVVVVTGLAFTVASASAQGLKQRAVLKGLTFGVDTLAISRDGKLLAAGGSYGPDGELKLWDLATGKVRPEFKAINQYPHVAFAPDGKTLASCGALRDDTGTRYLVKFYDPEGRKRAAHLEMPTSMIALAYSPDGKLLAIGCADKSVFVWDLPGKKEKFVLMGAHTDIIQAVAFSPDSKTIASGGIEDKIICLWDAEKGKERAVLKGHTDQIRDLAFSPDGKLLASAGWDKSVRLWDPASGEALRSLEGHSDRVRSVAFSPDGRLLASGGDAGVVHLWDPATGEALRSLAHRDAVTSVAFSPDGKTLAAALPHGEMLVLWDVARQKEKASLKVAAGPKRLAFTPDGKTLAVGNMDATVTLWDVAGK